jgi:nitroreductase
LNRFSIRHFIGESVSEEHLDIILKAAQQAPNLGNGQLQIKGADIFVTAIIDFNRPLLLWIIAVNK